MFFVYLQNIKVRIIKNLFVFFMISLSFILFNELYWLATSGGRVPVVAVCVLHT